MSEEVKKIDLGLTTLAKASDFVKHCIQTGDQIQVDFVDNKEGSAHRVVYEFSKIETKVDGDGTTWMKVKEK